MTNEGKSAISFYFILNFISFLQELEWTLELFEAWKFGPGVALLSGGNGMTRGGHHNENCFSLLRNALEPYFIAYWGVTRRLLEVRTL